MVRRSVVWLGMSASWVNHASGPGPFQTFGFCVTRSVSQHIGSSQDVDPLANAQAQARGLPRRDLQPGFSLTSDVGPRGAAGAGSGLRHGRRSGALGEAASRPPPAPRRAASADGRAAASTDAQIGSVAPGREVRIMLHALMHRMSNINALPQSSKPLCRSSSKPHAVSPCCRMGCKL